MGPGRPTKLDDLTAQRIVAAVKGGLPRVHAARMAKVDPTTLFRWLRLGREGQPAFCQFYQRVVEAEATNIEVLVGYMQEHAKVSHQACGWLLERRAPKQFGPRKAEAPTQAAVGVAAVSREERVSLLESMLAAEKSATG